MILQRIKSPILPSPRQLNSVFTVKRSGVTIYNIPTLCLRHSQRLFEELGQYYGALKLCKLYWNTVIICNLECTSNKNRGTEFASQIVIYNSNIQYAYILIAVTFWGFWSILSQKLVSIIFPLVLAGCVY